MKIAGDTHTHTTACGHAFSTLGENIAAAAAQGHKFICYTEHGPAMIPGIFPWYFTHQKRTIPREVDGVRVFLGCEANVLDATGATDIPDDILAQLDWVIASLHDTYRPGVTVDANLVTQTWLQVAKNPHIHCIGHLGNPRYRAHYPTVIKAFAEAGKIVEINCSSHITRPGSEGNCKEIAQLCVEHGVNMVLSSDAHFHKSVGAVQWGIDLCRELDIPEEMILNTDYDKFVRAVNSVQ